MINKLSVIQQIQKILPEIESSLHNLEDMARDIEILYCHGLLSNYLDLILLLKIDYKDHALGNNYLDNYDMLDDVFTSVLISDTEIILSNIRENIKKT